MITRVLAAEPRHSSPASSSRSLSINFSSKKGLKPNLPPVSIHRLSTARAHRHAMHRHDAVGPARLVRAPHPPPRVHLEAAEDVLRIVHAAPVRRPPRVPDVHPPAAPAPAHADGPGGGGGGGGRRRPAPRVGGRRRRRRPGRARACRARTACRMGAKRGFSEKARGRAERRGGAEGEGGAGRLRGEEGEEVLGWVGRVGEGVDVGREGGGAEGPAEGEEADSGRADRGGGVHPGLF